VANLHLGVEQDSEAVQHVHVQAFEPQEQPHLEAQAPQEEEEVGLIKDEQQEEIQQEEEQQAKVQDVASALHEESHTDDSVPPVEAVISTDPESFVASQDQENPADESFSGFNAPAAVVDPFAHVVAVADVPKAWNELEKQFTSTHRASAAEDALWAKLLQCA
jgi:hypothetical protein